MSPLELRPHDALCFFRDPRPPGESSGAGVREGPALVQQTHLQLRADPPVAVLPQHPQVGQPGSQHSDLGVIPAQACGLV